MAFEMKENTGSLFKNDKKESENHPDYTGQALINGVPMWISAWIKETGEGKKFFSFSFREKTAKPQEVNKSGPFKPEEKLPF